MGRHKQHKPRHHPRDDGDQPAKEWFGTSFHSTEGMHHLDVRQSGNGILITCSPAEVDGVAAAWSFRLVNDDNGRELTELGSALASGQGHTMVVDQGPGFETALVFLPDHPEENVGTLARVRAVEGAEDVLTVERRAERPMGLWVEAGEGLRRIVPLLGLGPGAPPADELGNCRLCPGCYRPVYESAASQVLIGPVPVIGLCSLCAEGTTLRSLRQAGVPIDPQQRAVLEAVAAALA
ncbi:hypothetical protein ACGFX2_32865 [Streptomyces goshikiensis]|uniref:hypothetical protein n=1 Tax=Streptomyces goshikiensis TaxID=1942 RepID=UPI00371CAF3D